MSLENPNIVEAIVAANPGWIYLEPCWNEDGATIHHFMKQPVIAWLIIREWMPDQNRWLSNVQAIVDQTGCVDEAFPAMMRPDGSIYRSNDTDFDSMEGLIEYTNERYGKK